MNVDNDLLEKIRQNGAQELEPLYVEFRNEFIGWMNKKYSVSHEDAKDIYQQTILTFYENIKSQRLTELSSKTKSYVFAIGGNKAKEHLRKTNRLVNNTNTLSYIEGLTEEEDKDKEASEKLVGVMQESLESLGEPCKSLLKNFYYQKHSLDRITETMGYKNRDTAKNQKYKCLQRLRKIFKTEAINVQ